MNRNTVFTVLLFLYMPLFAAGQIPVIQAGDELVTIRDGAELRKNGWTISPKLKPDIYITHSKYMRVTFYTDLDSISFRIEPNKSYDFIIRCGADSALTQIRHTPSHLDILKKAGKYDTTDRRIIPAFSYQSMDDPHLVALRKEFNLDSIAGNDNEITRVLRLMSWIHNLIPHDGNSQNPAVKNALSMIAECKKEKRGLNCRGLATVLNECYLALGLPSRFVTCMPKDSVFDDCHVINMVYLKSQKKWVWIDPTNNAYACASKVGVLSIEEVRERLAHEQPVTINLDANWNNREFVLPEEYLYKYMAKNLYRMECPLVSEYNMETAKPGKKITYVELLPLDAYNQTPYWSEHTDKKTGVTYIHYKTNNPAVFWALPE